MRVSYINHARMQMSVRGATEEEVVETLRSGVHTPGRLGRQIRVKVFTAGYQRRGRDYLHKEVEVIYAEREDTVVVVTVKTRYGMWEGAN